MSAILNVIASLEDTEIQPGALLELIQSVYKSIPVNIKLPDVSDTLRLFSKNLLIVVNVSSSKSSGDFPSKISLMNILHSGDRELINQASDAERVVYATIILLLKEDLAYVKCELRLFVRLGNLLDIVDDRTICDMDLLFSALIPEACQASLSPSSPVPCCRLSLRVPLRQ